jgi:predicted TPR repeat methyltransferase
VSRENQIYLASVNRRAWDAIGEQVASPYLDQPGYRAVFEQFMSRLEPGSEVLDLGCGPGIPVTRTLSYHFAVTGLDFSRNMVRAARRNVPGAKFVVADMSKMQMQKRFSGIVASYSLLCLPPSKFLLAAQNICAALRMGGLCFIALNDGDGGGLVQLGSRVVYAHAYSEAEVRAAFLTLAVLDVRRDVVQSKMFGIERSISFLLQAS